MYSKIFIFKFFVNYQIPKIYIERSYKMKNKSSNVLLGVFLILMGIGFAGRTLNLWHFSIFFHGWWTLFIIVPCLVSVSKNGFNPIPTAGLIIGFLLLLSEWHLFPGYLIWRLFFPIIFVIAGVSILYKDSSRKKRTKQHISPEAHSDAPEYSAIFSSQNLTFDYETFNGASINAIFGGIDLNLRNAYFQEDVVLNCTSVFGGIDIRVPANINVQVSCVPIFGGVSNRAKNNNPGAPTLFINANCMFGGIDIR